MSAFNISMMIKIELDFRKDKEAGKFHEHLKIQVTILPI